MEEKILILKDVKFANFRTLADGSIRISFDTQELSVEDTTTLIEIFKTRECGMVLGNGQTYDDITDVLKNAH